jgi:hypothetical protein
MSIEYNAVLRPIVLGAKFRVVMSPITVHLWGPQHQFIQYPHWIGWRRVSLLAFKYRQPTSRNSQFHIVMPLIAVYL